MIVTLRRHPIAIAIGIAIYAGNGGRAATPDGGRRTGVGVTVGRCDGGWKTFVQIEIEIEIGIEIDEAA